MQPADSRAGGCFILVAIMAGFFGGLAMQNALAGVWIGLGVGIIVALIVWLLDRKRA
ncbi:hypothetical protein H8M03_03855 [Sphingomonas sabuli]|uniref:Uncharacterized protein n=1 Tax=Sphingomonas sabuli TaxID=2764186 RepID=A0A7G9L4D0_9SPHN|nr:hypothetical protein [Sphingomonas sabuli]QNM83479.1 hypothetical protein H8M03_03855 [Sphingomonas sabuli]